MVESIIGLPDFSCLNTSAVGFEVFSDFACGEKS
jgi:hypothetical protein